jgi:hypothetical protein
MLRRVMEQREVARNTKAEEGGWIGVVGVKRSLLDLQPKVAIRSVGRDLSSVRVSAGSRGRAAPILAVRSTPHATG